MADLHRWKTECVPRFTHWMVEPSDKPMAWLTGEGNSIWRGSIQTPYLWPVAVGPLCVRSMPRRHPGNVEPPVQTGYLFVGLPRFELGTFGPPDRCTTNR